MKITVFGANGLTGRQLVQRALDAGHDVVAVTRHPADYPLTHERMIVPKQTRTTQAPSRGLSKAPTPSCRLSACRSPASRSTSTAPV